MHPGPPLLALLFACTEVAAGPPVAAAPVAAATSPGVLSVRLSGFRSAQGQVLIAVFRGETGFPGSPDKAWKTMVATISGDTASVDLRDVPPGDYAVSVVHDENGNNALDTSWIGIPKEGIGMSNNAKGRMGPPKYRDAKFVVEAGGTLQNIRMVYL
jgi:uncharacterized protein (DUF2141 family)